MICLTAGLLQPILLQFQPDPQTDLILPKCLAQFVLAFFFDFRFLEPPKCITRLVVAFCRLFIFYLFVLLLPPFYTSTSHNSLLYIYNFSNRWTLIVIADISDDIHHSCPFFPKFFVFSYLLPKSIIYMYCNLIK